MNLLVVGAGEMGRWLADTVDADVAFTDADSETFADLYEQAKHNVGADSRVSEE